MCGTDKDPVRDAQKRYRRNDARIIDAYQRGERWAFERVESWIRPILARHYGRLEDEFDDLCQTVHEKLLANLRSNRFAGKSELRTYVTRISLRTAIDRLRELYRQRALSDVPEARRSSSVPLNPYGHAQQLDEGRQLHQVLQSLPPRCRELWHLVFVERLSYDEIARRQCIPEGTVKSRMWHCRRKAMALLRSLK